MLALMGGMFKAMWNNFYTAVVVKVSPSTRGFIILAIFVCACLCIIGAIKGGKDGKPVKNWFLFWMAIILALLGAAYTIIQAL